MSAISANDNLLAAPDLGAVAGSAYENFTFASFFACAGGADYGMKAAGAHPVYANELRKPVAALYKLNHGHDVDCRPIEKTGPSDYGNPTVMVGGFPCQPFSTAGMQRGADDIRGQLGVVFANKIAETMPPAFIAENVAPFLLNGRFASVFAAMRAAWGGSYRVTPFTLNAWHYGVPQERKRSFIVGYRSDLGIRFRPGNIRPAFGTTNLRAAIGDLEGKAFPYAGAKPLSGHEYLTTPISPFISERGPVRGWDEPSYTVLSFTASIPLHPEPVAEASISPGGVIYSRKTGAYHRRMTVRECARVQTFPDSFSFGEAGPVLAHDVIGNAIPPVLMERIAAAVRDDLVRAGVIRITPRPLADAA